MNDALKVTGLKTKKEAVELGLKILVKLNQQEAIKAFRGKLTWDGDLEVLRSQP
jgi:Arc/MetJ family transcription regulator